MGGRPSSSEACPRLSGPQSWVCRRGLWVPWVHRNLSSAWGHVREPHAASVSSPSSSGVGTRASSLPCPHHHLCLSVPKLQKQAWSWCWHFQGRSRQGGVGLPFRSGGSRPVTACGEGPHIHPYSMARPFQNVLRCRSDLPSTSRAERSWSPCDAGLPFSLRLDVFTRHEEPAFVAQPCATFEPLTWGRWCPPATTPFSSLLGPRARCAPQLWPPHGRFPLLGTPFPSPLWSRPLHCTRRSCRGHLLREAHRLHVSPGAPATQR